MITAIRNTIIFTAVFYAFIKVKLFLFSNMRKKKKEQERNKGNEVMNK